MKIIILGIPHTKTTLDYSTCAFTQKTFNLCKMMYERGHEVIHIGVEGSNPLCTKNINIINEELFKGYFGGNPGTNFYQTTAEGKFAAYHKLWITNAKRVILNNCNKPYSTILAHSWGGSQAEATKDIPQYRVETGIGYPHTFAPYRVFESYAWLNFHHCLENRRDGNRWYDVAIPNGFDITQFTPVDPCEKEDYLLFIGRLNEDKGVQIAIDVAKATNHRIKICGQGNPEKYLLNNPHVEYVKPVGVEGRRTLMAKAKAFLCPTIYTEPLGFVSIEAQLSGTPSITSGFGGLNETVLHGITGYICRTFDHFCWAVNNIHMINPRMCRQWTEQQFSIERSAVQYEEYFQMILDLNKNGWYERHPERTNLNWLKSRGIYVV